MNPDVEAHVDAFEAFLDGAHNPIPNYLSESPNNTHGGYVVLHPDPGNDLPTDLSGDNPLLQWTIQTTCIGDTPEQAIAIFRLTQDAVRNKRPAVAGWVCTPVRKHIARLVERDDSVDPAKFFIAAQWRWYSNPA